MTTTIPTAASTILAIDLGKYKSVACLYAGSPDSARFDSFTTDRARLTQLLQRCQPSVVVIEACLLAGWVHDLCGHLGFPGLVANTASEAGSSSTANARPTATTLCVWPNSTL